MKKIILFIIVIVLALAPLANAFKMKFENTTNKTLIYRLYWLAPDWENAPRIANVMGGELDAGKSNTSISSYKPGPYVITWRSPSVYGYKFDKKYYFEAKQKDNIIISKPNSKVIVK